MVRILIVTLLHIPHRRLCRTMYIMRHNIFKLQVIIQFNTVIITKAFEVKIERRYAKAPRSYPSYNKKFLKNLLQSPAYGGGGEQKKKFYL